MASRISSLDHLLLSLSSEKVPSEEQGWLQRLNKVEHFSPRQESPAQTYTFRRARLVRMPCFDMDLSYAKIHVCLAPSMRHDAIHLHIFRISTSYTATQLDGAIMSPTMNTVSVHHTPDLHHQTEQSDSHPWPTPRSNATTRITHTNA